MFLIANVFGIRVPHPLGRGLQLGTQGLFLTNERERIEKLVSPMLKLAMGTLEYSYLLDTAHAIHQTLTFSKAESDSRLLEEFIGHWLQHVRGYFQSLWLIRDHAVRFEMGFAEWVDSSRGLTHSSNFIAASTFKSDGSRDTTEFTLDELKAARSYFIDFLHPLATDQSEELEDVIGSGRPTRPFRKGLSRLTRFNYFLSAARAAGELAVRISLYMTCMEVLFSTETAELTYRLSQRVAYFLGDTSEQRKEIFLTMKRAYGIRSRILHGDTLPPKSESNLENVSSEIDSLLRRIFLKILGSKELVDQFEQPSTKLEEYFLDLIFQKGETALPEP